MKVYVKEAYSLFLPNTDKISTTGAHEIGHTLGMTHTDTGIMSESQNEYRTDEVQQENLRQMLQSESGEIDIITKIFNMFLNESKK